MSELNTNRSVSVGTDPVVVSVERDITNGRRVSIILINTSTGGQVISLSIDAPAVAGSGIVLSPGGVWQDSMDGGYYPTQKRIVAIADLAGGSLSHQERIGGV